MNNEQQVREAFEKAFPELNHAKNNDGTYWGYTVALRFEGFKAALASAPEAGKWMPIETAPKDGAEIFIYKHGWDYAVKAKWGENQAEDGAFFGWVFDEDGAFCGWVFDDYLNLGGCEDGFLGWYEDIEDGLMPTLWLPTPPRDGE